MKNKSLEIPNDLIFDQNLTDSQRIILSALSTKPKQHAIDLSKRIGKKINTVRQELEELTRLNYVITSNGSNRLSYTKAKGFGFVGDNKIQPQTTFDGKENLNPNITSPRRSDNIIFETKFQSNKIRMFNTFEDKTLGFKIEDQVEEAFQYWLKCGGTRHRQPSEAYKTAMEYLTKLFEGTMFENVPNDVLHSPILTKRTKFTLEDWKTSLDNYTLAKTSKLHHPSNKKGINAKRGLKDYILNPWMQHSSKLSMFEQFLDPPKRINNEVEKYPKLGSQIAYVFKNYRTPNQPLDHHLVAATNRFGDLINRHERSTLSYESLNEKAQIFMEFVEDQIDNRRFKPHWLSSDWFIEKLQLWLDYKGLISLGEY